MQKRNNSLKRLAIYGGMGMVVIFFAFGALLIFTHVFEDMISGTNKYLLGGLSFLYGFFRIVRVQRQMQSLKQDETP
ncbi:MAG: hypothetical protein RL220_21 [Bacteroidota bacterium]|jgi:hypothetical protein